MYLQMGDFHSHVKLCEERLPGGLELHVYMDEYGEIKLLFPAGTYGGIVQTKQDI